jgi:o-succinylbenzoate synthase
MVQGFEFRPYQRQFTRPLQTHHGLWEVRAGIVLKLTDRNGQVSWGEIAPIPWFGSETLEQALEFCRQLPDRLSESEIFAIPDRLPACQFGFESAWMGLTTAAARSLPFSALLPAGKAALETWETHWEAGQRTFKWKIGVGSIDLELNLLNQLVQTLPPTANLRLDANGGLSFTEAQIWLEQCDRLAIEFLEQPLPPNQLDGMLELAAEYVTPIALDESVATLTQLAACYDQGWRGVFVIKPAIVGSPRRLRQFCHTHAIDAVFSSSLETAIGRRAGLTLAAELTHPNRAIGYGTASWFADPDPADFDPADFDPANSDPDNFEQLWQRL